jgi:hypothetical protein
MGIEYVIDFACTVKNALPPEKFMGLIKTRDQANAILTQVRNPANQKSPAETRIRRALSTPQGLTQQEVSIQAMLNEAAELQPYEHYCEGCQANALNRPFGCYGYISYPIKVETEEWLMSRLPEKIESTAGNLLRSAIRDFRYDGSPLTNMRKQGHFFEKSTPVKRKWGSFLSKWELTSDQLLQMMFCLGALHPSHTTMLMLFLGILPHNIEPQQIQNPASLGTILPNAFASVDQGNLQIQEVIGFMKALKTAAMLEVKLFTDY